MKGEKISKRKEKERCSVMTLKVKCIKTYVKYVLKLMK
jgi:hypothetical protein